MYQDTHATGRVSVQSNTHTSALACEVGYLYQETHAMGWVNVLSNMQTSALACEVG